MCIGIYLNTEVRTRLYALKSIFYVNIKNVFVNGEKSPES